MFGLGKSKAVVGLDIGSSAVKAVELKAVGKSFKVAAFATEPIPPDSIVDGAIIDGTAVADAIKRLFANKAFKTTEVAASRSGKGDTSCTAKQTAMHNANAADVFDRTALTFAGVTLSSL